MSALLRVATMCVPLSSSQFPVQYWLYSIGMHRVCTGSVSAELTESNAVSIANLITMTGCVIGFVLLL